MNEVLAAGIARVHERASSASDDSPLAPLLSPSPPAEMGAPAADSDDLVEADAGVGPGVPAAHGDEPPKPPDQDDATFLAEAPDLMEHIRSGMLDIRAAKTLLILPPERRKTLLAECNGQPDVLKLVKRIETIASRAPKLLDYLNSGTWKVVLATSIAKLPLRQGKKITAECNGDPAKARELLRKAVEAEGKREEARMMKREEARMAKRKPVPSTTLPKNLRASLGDGRFIELPKVSPDEIEEETLEEDSHQVARAPLQTSANADGTFPNGGIKNYKETGQPAQYDWNHPDEKDGSQPDDSNNAGGLLVPLPTEELRAVGDADTPHLPEELSATESTQDDADHPECHTKGGEQEIKNVQADERKIDSAGGHGLSRAKEPITPRYPNGGRENNQVTDHPESHPKGDEQKPEHSQQDDADYSKMFRAASECEMRAVGWLVPGYVPLRNLTLFHGAGETCKSLMAIHLAAKISRGKKLDFDKSDSPPTDGHVLILAHEDTAEEAIKPRLHVAGADMTKIHFRADGKDIRLPEDIKALRWLIRRYSVKLVIIDTLDDFATQSTNNNQSVRGILNALGDLAEQENIAIIIITHWTKQKSKRGNLRAKIAGSFGIPARGRCAYAFVADPDKPGILMVSTKGSLGGRKPTVLFDVDIEALEIGGQLVDQPKVVYLGTTNITENDFESKAGKVDEAIQFLEDILRSGPVDSREIIDKCPVSRQTLFSAKKTMGVVDFRQGQGQDHRSFWKLPDGYVFSVEKEKNSNGAEGQ